MANATYDEWTTPMGYLLVAQGICYLVPYVLCLTVMVQPTQLRHSCYKLMLLMGILDVLEVINGSILSGFMSIYGTPITEYYYLLKLQGGSIASLWFIYGITNVSLAFNRLINLTSPDCAKRLYGGQRTWLWMVGAIGAGAAIGAVLFTPNAALIYHSGLGFHTFGVGVEGPPFGLIIGRLFNSSLVCALPLTYVGVMVALRRRTRGAQTRALSRKRRSVLLQSLLISLMTTACAVTYVTIPYWPIANPKHYVVVTLIWQLAQGGNCLVYLALNRTIRKGVRNLCCKAPIAKKLSSPSSQQVASLTPTREAALRIFGKT